MTAAGTGGRGRKNQNVALPRLAERLVLRDFLASQLGGRLDKLLSDLSDVQSGRRADGHSHFLGVLEGRAGLPIGVAELRRLDLNVMAHEETLSRRRPGFRLLYFQYLAALFTEGFMLAIFLVFLTIVRGGVPLTIFWLPVILVPQLLVTAGLTWILAALGVFIRDLAQIVVFLLQLVFFLTPILYPEAQLAAVAPLLGWNPVLIIVRAYRSILLDGTAPAALPLLWMTLFGFALAVAGYAWFHRLRRSFADIL